ncbi:hypothetical protein [Cesiribacter andamanensis]|uniref:DUF3098 domain-containing protein n=1 Tax=Cesiribacter andamanensis AMV16 TaxID=1279009 RepID=M7N1C6_9BACT|nr:hypothetical protein [Cesiribacter andamanensis]EMR02483.1 hypothetical protein ADICEAN_02356 [Cesiribacter andamanensis AMV16]
MSGPRTRNLHKAAFTIGVLAVLLGLTVMLMDFLQGQPFSVFSLTPVTVGILAIAVSLQKPRRGSNS